jgi:hypothetical protein
LYGFRTIKEILVYRTDTDIMVEQCLPIAPIASRRSASCTIANSRVGSALSFFETSFLNPAVKIVGARAYSKNISAH